MFYQLLSVLLSAACTRADLQYYAYSPSIGYGRNISSLNTNVTLPTPQRRAIDGVDLDVYYESLCPDSIKLYTEELYPLVKALNRYLQLRTYPYGKATTMEYYGGITFNCQHGEKECYGNKLHACAIDHLRSVGSWLSFNKCLLTRNSDDFAADWCGQLLSIDSEAIKRCANSDRGNQLLKYYGEQSNKVSYDYIPHVVINGEPMNKHANLIKSVCRAYRIPPEACLRYR